jgi:hypothetical protein
MDDLKNDILLRKRIREKEEELGKLRLMVKQANAIHEAGQWAQVTIDTYGDGCGVKVDHTNLVVKDAPAFRGALRKLISDYCVHDVPKDLLEEILSSPPAFLEE